MRKILFLAALALLCAVQPARACHGFGASFVSGVRLEAALPPPEFAIAVDPCSVGFASFRTFNPGFAASFGVTRTAFFGGGFRRGFGAVGFHRGLGGGVRFHGRFR